MPDCGLQPPEPDIKSFMGTEDGYKWRLDKGFRSLLDHPDGPECLKLESYLKKRGQLSYLEFIWALKGMKALVTEQKSQRNKELVTCLYRQYIVSGNLSAALSNTTFLEIVQKISTDFEKLSGNFKELKIFNGVEEEVRSYLVSVIYPQFLKDFKDDKELVNEAYSNFRCNTSSKSVKRNESLIINEDGLPKLPFLEGSTTLTCSSKPPNEPEIFAKELIEKLEILQQKPELRSSIKCLECQNEEIELRKSFSVQLAKAIEAKLVISDIRTEIGPETKLNAKCKCQMIPKLTKSHGKK